MTKQQSIDRVSTVTLDVSKTAWKQPRGYRYSALAPVGLENYKGLSYQEKVVTVTRGTVQIEIDIEALVDWMARRALHTKSGKSNMQDGLVVATVLKTEVLSTEGTQCPPPANCAWI